VLPNPNVRPPAPVRIAAAARGLVVAGSALCLASLVIPWQDCMRCNAEDQARVRWTLARRLHEAFTPHVALIIGGIVAASVVMILVGMFAGPKVLAVCSWLFVAGAAEGLRAIPRLYHLYHEAGDIRSWHPDPGLVSTSIGPTAAHTGVWLVFMGGVAVVLQAIVSWALTRRRRFAPATIASSAGRR
jgi:hypothetical protein